MIKSFEKLAIVDREAEVNSILKSLEMRLPSQVLEAVDAVRGLP